MAKSSIFSSTMYFSYSQFFVFDRSIAAPACSWTQAHFDQGFARRERNAAFGTLLEFGHAELTVFLAPYEAKDDHERVVEVPIELPSGAVVIGGPEEFEDTCVVNLPPGHFRLTVAQAAFAEDLERVELYFEQLETAVAHSRVLRADAALCPSLPLIETCDEVVL